LKERTCRLLLI